MPWTSLRLEVLLLLLLLHSQAIFLGFTILGEIFECVTIFFTTTIKVFVDGAGWVCFFTGIHPSRTWLSGSLWSMWWNTCVHRLDLVSYSYPKEFWRNGVRTHDNSKGKFPSTIKILLRGGSNPWCCIKQDSEPNTLPTELFPPLTRRWIAATISTEKTRLSQSHR